MLVAELYNLTLQHLPHSLLFLFGALATSFFTAPLCFCAQVIWGYYNAYSRSESAQPGLPPGYYGVAFIGETSSALKHKEQFFVQRAKLYGTNVFVTALASPIVERGGSGVEFAKRCVCIISNKSSNNNKSLTRILLKVLNEKSTDHIDIDREISTIVASFFKRLIYCDEAISMTEQAAGLACDILLSLFLGVPVGLDTTYTLACKAYASSATFDEKQRHKRVIMCTIRRALGESRHSVEMWTQKLLPSAESADRMSEDEYDCYYTHMSAFFLENVLKTYKDSEPEAVVAMLFNFIIEANLLPLIEHLKAIFRAVVPDFSADDTPVALCRQSFAAYMYGCRAEADGPNKTPMSSHNNSVSSARTDKDSAPSVSWSIEIAAMAESERRAFSSDSLAFLDSLSEGERARQANPTNKLWYLDIGNFLGLSGDDPPDESDSVSTGSGVSTPQSSLHRISPLPSSRGSSAFHSIMASAAAPSPFPRQRARASSAQPSAGTPSPARAGPDRYLRTVPSPGRDRQASEALKQAYVHEVYELVTSVRRSLPKRAAFPSYDYSVCTKAFTVESDNGAAYTVPRGFGVLLVSTDKSSLAELIGDEEGEGGSFREAAEQQSCMIFDIVAAVVVQEMVQKYTFNYLPVFGDAKTYISNLTRINYLQ